MPGRVQEGPRSPPGPTTNYSIVRKIFICSNIFVYGYCTPPVFLSACVCWFLFNLDQQSGACSRASFLFAAFWRGSLLCYLLSVVARYCWLELVQPPARQVLVLRFCVVRVVFSTLLALEPLHMGALHLLIVCISHGDSLC